MSDSVRHPLFARFYSRVVVPRLTQMGVDDLRVRTLDGLKGTVVEVGCGDGANLAHYPDTVTRIIAVEPEGYLRERAARHADERLELRDGVSQRLPVEDGVADAVVFTLVLCSVDQRHALAEARRVLRPGGELRFLEHVRSHRPGAVRRLQKVMDATVWPLPRRGLPRRARHRGRDRRRPASPSPRSTGSAFPEGARGPESSVILGRAVRVGPSGTAAPARPLR